jgi:AcrR family transcriptional regulator
LVNLEAVAIVKAPQRRQERGRRRIALLLDVADQVFADVGYEAATTNAIAARAGMSPGSLYQFFPNKEAIAEALAERYVAQLEATHDVALDLDVAHLSLDALIDRIVDPLVALHVANPSLHALLNGSDISPRLAASTQGLHEAVLERVEAVIDARAPQLRREERRRAARVSVQIFKAIQPLVLAAGATERPALVRELKAALRGYLQQFERED